MGPRALLRSLTALARRAGVDVRDEPLASGRAGHCTVRGRVIVLLDSRASTFERACALADALRPLDLAPWPLPPEVRAFLRAPPRPPRLVDMARLRPLAKARPGQPART